MIKKIDDYPRLFGIVNSNRDYATPYSWGKNQFNSSFPAALACYLYSKKMKKSEKRPIPVLPIIPNFSSIYAFFSCNVR